MLVTGHVPSKSPTESAKKKILCSGFSSDHEKTDPRAHDELTKSEFPGWDWESTFLTSSSEVPDVLHFPII